MRTMEPQNLPIGSSICRFHIAIYSHSNHYDYNQTNNNHDLKVGHVNLSEIDY
jgi:hypothetical protein